MVSFHVWCGYYLHLRLTVLLREYRFGDWRKNSDKRDEKGSCCGVLATFPKKHYATGCAFTRVAVKEAVDMKEKS